MERHNAAMEACMARIMEEKGILCQENEFMRRRGNSNSEDNVPNLNTHTKVESYEARMHHHENEDKRKMLHALRDHVNKYVKVVKRMRGSSSLE